MHAHSCTRTHHALAFTHSLSHTLHFKTADHPEPGKPFAGTEREAFLPDSPQGNEVLALLRTAFERRLTFTVGTSITMGPRGGIRVIWNGIHHKTDRTGTFGYPDDTYFARVKEELASLGVK